MLRSGRFWVGLAAGAAAAWWWRRRQAGQLIAATPRQPRLTRRRGRLGAGWAGGQGQGSYR